MESVPHILMMIESSRESGRRLIAGVADYARHFGPWRFHWQPQGLAHIVTPLEEMKFDGMLVRDVAEVQPLVESGIPAVTFTYSKQQMAGTVMVNTDDRGISEVVAHHFIQRGFKHFAFYGYQERPWSIGREKGFIDAVQAAGYTVDSLCIPAPGSSEEIDDSDILCWLSSLPRPVALMAVNDELGRKIVNLCQEANLRVPDDCAVVGVDNDPVVCGMSNPPLSSVIVDQYQSGYRAAALDQMMKGESPSSRIITASAGELVIRQSSDIFTVDDAAVAKALRFIHENAYRPLKVDEIALASGVYRRGLERRFRAHMSRTIQEYFREARAEHLAKILRESRLNLEEIAYQCGFAQASHLTRFFVALRGETPSAYRKRVLPQ